MQSWERSLMITKTGKSLYKNYQLLTNPKEDYLKEIFCGIVKNNLIRNSF